MINLTNFIDVSCRRAIANASTLHVGGSEFGSRRWTLLFRFFFFFCRFVLFCFVLFCFFRKANFHFLRLKVSVNENFSTLLDFVLFGFLA